MPHSSCLCFREGGHPSNKTSVALLTRQSTRSVSLVREDGTDGEPCVGGGKQTRITMLRTSAMLVHLYGLLIGVSCYNVAGANWSRVGGFINWESVDKILQQGIQKKVFPGNEACRYNTVGGYIVGCIINLARAAGRGGAEFCYTTYPQAVWLQLATRMDFFFSPLRVTSPMGNLPLLATPTPP